MEEEEFEESGLKFPEGYFYFDKSNMKRVLDEMPLHIRNAVDLGKNITLMLPVRQVFICGMGGSGIAGNLIKAYLKDCKVPVHVVNDYAVPAFCTTDSMVIVISYSGETEETISCFRDAARKTQNIVAITSGGRLEEIAKAHRKECIIVPKGYQPRNAIPFLFFAVLNILVKLRIAPDPDNDIKTLIQQLNPQSIDKIALGFARKLMGKVPLIYSSEAFYPVAYRWKTSFNENSKVMAFSAPFSELNHNEMMGYVKIRGPFSLIILKTDDDLRRVVKRMDLTKDIAKKAGVEVIEIMLKGHALSKIFSAILMGDYISYYLALANKVDPSQVMLIERFKKELGHFV